MKKIVMFLVILALMIVCCAVPSEALLKITPTNLDDLFDSGDIGTIIAGFGPNTTDIITTPVTGSLDMGDLTATVYENSGINTYVFTVDPSDADPLVDYVSEVNTGFSVDGFINVAGYSFDEVIAAGINMTAAKAANAFSIYHEDDGSLDLNVNALYQRFNKLWENPVPITFFYQSTTEPGTGGCYNVYDGYGGQGINYYPVASIPEPPTALLIISCLSCLMGLGLFIKKFKNIIKN